VSIRYNDVDGPSATGEAAVRIDGWCSRCVSER
jgi:hypothetical protein